MKRVNVKDLPPPDPRILQEMLTTRTPPGTKNSERAFLAGRNSLAEMSPASRMKWLRMAKRAGMSLDGKIHMNGLGDGLDSWVSNWDEALHRYRKQDKYCVYRHGELVFQPTEKEPEPDVPLAEDIVRESVRDLVQENPSLKRKKYGELREMAIDKYGPQKV